MVSIVVFTKADFFLSVLNIIKFLSVSVSKVLTFVLRLSVFLTVIYAMIAYFFYFIQPPEYTYRKQDFYQNQATILMQPIMDIFGYQKVSHWYDWQDLPRDQIPKNIQPLVILGGSDYRKLDQKSPVRNTLASLGKVVDSAIIEPVDYDGSWSLVFCTQDMEFCQQSNILAKGRVKILADGNSQAWGKNEQGEIIQLRIVGYATRDRYKAVVHI